MVQEMRGVIRFDLGEPDFDTPQYIKDAAVKALKDGYTHYTSSAGLIELREAIAEKLVWLPTWHQARLLCQQLSVPDSAVANIWQNQTSPSAGDELRQIYELLIAALKA